MKTVAIVSPLLLGLLLPLVVANLALRWRSRKAGAARGRMERVKRAALCLAIGVVSTLVLLLPLLITCSWFQAMPHGDANHGDSFGVYALLTRPLALRPYLTMAIVALAAAFYAVASYQVWRHYNPIPVVTILFPVGEGLLVIRRAIAPALGQLAFPGGYIDEGESWQAAAVRELNEETGINVNPDDLDIFRVSSTRRGHLLVVYALVKQPEPEVAQTPVLTPEVSELCILMRPIQFVWNQDTEAAQQYFANRPTANLQGAEIVQYPGGPE